jgi:hypothetical protein
MDTDTVEIPLEPFDIDWYDPGENCNPKGSGYQVRQEWYCQPPAMTEPYYCVRDDWGRVPRYQYARSQDL